ncbi:AAA family ATPase [Methyloraptor flagellatus]|uniref:AAA family ATPase n=1 Tax=Methyloraptor flagellatus TaxID=3162530 RepID=A0AAU7X9E7_9HYPH
MRILAIRGQNLASLAERFDLDFTAAPLAGAGLFAITGETGAGKSTILDAMCLALYGEFPRIGRDRGSDEKIPDTGDEKLRVTDPASILRKGAPTGFAEVDFLARDGHPYRARWSIARARGKADGRLQDPMRRLDRLDDSGAVVLRLADKARAVDKAVLDLTDLTFEQFTRTVLLSQGDFDAFLRAKDGERAELLEKITGTDLYAKVSMEVFERTRAAEKAVTALEERRAMIPVLSEAERAALAERIAAIGTDIKALRARADTETDELARAERIIAAEAEVAAAEAALGTARAASEAAAEDRAHLAALRAAQAVRPVFDRLADATLRLDRAEAALREAAGTVAKATEAANLAQEQLTTTEDASEAARRDVERFDPIWAAAMRLDGAIVDARRERDAAAEAVTKDERQAVEQRSALDAAKGQVEGRHTGLAEIEAALAASTGMAALAGRWADLGPLINERRQEKQAASDAAQSIAASGQTIADCDARLAALAEADGKDATERADRTAQLDERRAARAAIDVAGLEARREAVETLGRAIADLRRVFEDAAERTETCREARDRRTAAEAAARAAGEQLEKLGQDRIAAADRRTGHQALADFADQILSVHASRMRAELAEGEPCPVCGSTHHPATDAALTARAEAIRAERATLDKVIADLDTAIATGRGELAGHQAASNDAADRIAKAEAQLAALAPEIASRTATIVETALDLGLTTADEPPPQPSPPSTFGASGPPAPTSKPATGCARPRRSTPRSTLCAVRSKRSIPPASCGGPSAMPMSPRAPRRHSPKQRHDRAATGRTAA